jgi:hypothetical protein
MLAIVIVVTVGLLAVLIGRQVRNRKEAQRKSQQQFDNFEALLVQAEAGDHATQVKLTDAGSTHYKRIANSRGPEESQRLRDRLDALYCEVHNRRCYQRDILRIRARAKTWRAATDFGDLKHHAQLMLAWLSGYNERDRLGLAQATGIAYQEIVSRLTVALNAELNRLLQAATQDEEALRTAFLLIQQINGDDWAYIRQKLGLPQLARPADWNSLVATHMTNPAIRLFVVYQPEWWSIRLGDLVARADNAMPRPGFDGDIVEAKIIWAYVQDSKGKLPPQLPPALYDRLIKFIGQFNRQRDIERTAAAATQE